ALGRGLGAAGRGCRLALVDLRSGNLQAPHPACDPRDIVTGLALAATSAGPVAYLAIWRPAALVNGEMRPAGAQVVELSAATGALIAETPLTGLPRPAAAGGTLALAPGPYGPALYCVEAMPGSTWDRWSEQEY